LLSSHLLTEVETLVQRVIIINHGHLGLAKKLSELESEPVIVVEVRTHQKKDLREAVSQKLAKSGWPIRRLDLKRRSLQDRWNEINNMDPLAPQRAPAASVTR